MKGTLRVSFCGMLGFLLILSGSLLAQTSTSITGTVLDQSGAVVPGAMLTMTSKATGATRTATSDNSGVYVFPQINPGVYALKAEKQGFKTVVLEDIEVLVNTAQRIDMRFDVGAVTETVVVTATAATINTVDATIGNAFNSVQVRDLPLSGRNVVGLLSLQPGVTPAIAGMANSQSASVNGGRFDQANVTLDGVDVNDQDQFGGDNRSGQTFFSVLRVTPDSLQEFRVTTTNPNADQGRSSGAQIAMVTKGGTNAFHGSLYEYHRNTVTSANDWFSNKAGVSRAKLLRNNFGGSIGGPIKRDKLFFFFNYEGFREAKGTAVTNQIPLPTLGQGIVRYFSANGASDPSCPSGTPAGVTCLTRAQISAAYLTANGVDPGTNSAGLAVLAAAAGKYTANDTTVGDGLNTSGLRFNATTPVKQATATARVDYNLTSKQNLYIRGNYQNDTSVNASRFPDSPQPTVWAHPRGLVASHAWSITPTILNSFRYGITRDAVTTGGDSNQNSTVFRFIYQPFTYSRARVRTTPVHNFVDDISISRGKHTFQGGVNFRLVSNTRNAFTASYDTMTTNPSGYEASGDVLYLKADGSSIFPNVASRSTVNLRDALAAVIGRFSQYSANLVYDKSGKVQPVGTGVARTFSTQEYEAYFQDSWHMRSNLTVNYGLHWSTSTPVYEANGFQVSPNPGLGVLFDRRVAGSAIGNPVNDLISLNYSGKANNKPGFYSQDWNNFAPGASVAWQINKKTVLRGGYRLTYDRIGSALAVNFDAVNTVGFTSAAQIAVNTYNTTTSLGPLLTGLGQDVRSLPKLIIPQSLAFPSGLPADRSRRIQSSLDDRLTTPYNHQMNLGVGRDLGHGYSFEAAYVGRIARNLLISRDVLTPNNITDPKSGVDWFTAIRQLIDLRDAVTPITSLAPIPYFENLLPRLAGNYSVLGTTRALTATQAAYRRVARTVVGGLNTTDYTTVQDIWDSGFSPGLFYQPQYGSLSAFSTLGTSDFHSAQFSFRKQLDKGFSFDLNYTTGHSLDTASGGQDTNNTGNFGAPFVRNPFNLNANRANSNFDIRHIVNFNYLYDLPVGRGKRFLPNLNKVGQAFLGGWQTTGIFRWNSGLPSGQPTDASQWATNFNAQSAGIALRKVVASPTRTGDPNLFSDPTYAYQSYRNAYPGESGTRNDLRLPSFVNFDFGLYKSFDVTERIKLKFRWEVFNLTNTQHFRAISTFGLVRDPWTSQTPGGAPPSPPSTFGKFTAIQGEPRVMQFALRIEF